jgi:hypothetical protein
LLGLNFILFGVIDHILRTVRLVNIVTLRKIKVAKPKVNGTSVFQDSILSPYLYSVYINQLPARLYPQAITTNMSPMEITPLLTRLLYADDAVLIAERIAMIDLLRKSEEHSL